MTTIVKAADAAQFLALVPRMLGYRPTRSVILIPFHGSRSLGAMRVDLPDCNDDDEADRSAATFLGMVCRLPDADAVAAVVYTDAAFDGGPPHARLVRALERRAHACGLRITDALVVAVDAWGSYLDPDLPTDGRSLALMGDEPAGAEHLAVADGDQAAGSELPICDPDERERVGRALRALDGAVTLVCGTDAAAGRAGGRQASAARRDSFGRPPRRPERTVGDETGNRRTARTSASDLDALVPLAAEDSGDRRIDPLALAAVCTLDDLPALFEDALRWDLDDLPAYDAATIIWCLARPALRDIALMEWCGGLAAGDEAFDAQLRWESGEEYPPHLAMHMWGEGQRPQPERLEKALTLARWAAAVASPAVRPGPLATCAWLAWALGRSTHAERYAVQACDLEPEHGLAEIVRSFVHAGHLPDWAFRPR